MQTLNINYDKKNDILYISIGEPVPSISEEQEEGIVIRRNMITNAISGVTILDYKERINRNEKIKLPNCIDISSIRV